jgi:hypothetical protein
MRSEVVQLNSPLGTRDDPRFARAEQGPRQRPQTLRWCLNYGFDEECAPDEASGGPFSIGFYPPLVCSHDPRHELGRPFASPPNGFWFTGNEHCVSAGRPFSGSVFTWHVQLPQSGPWHVEVHIPSWTMYGQGNHYIVSSDEGAIRKRALTGSLPWPMGRSRRRHA